MTELRPAYLDIVETGARELSRPHLAEFWEGEYRDDEWGGRHRIMQDFALVYAVLYESTGRDDYRDEAIAHLVEFGQGDHFASVLTGAAYELVGDHLEPEERTAFGAEWVAAAEDQLDQYVGDADVDEWDHVPNHAIAACYYADYASHLFPEEGAKHSYSDRTDRVWDAWWECREFHEQASNYEGFTETFLARWAALRGMSEEFYATPSVQNMFERNLRVIAPSGMISPYGDTGYNGHQCQWLGLLERVAADTGDGRFRDAAEDAFAYFREYIFPEFCDTVDRLLETEGVYNGRLIYKNHLHELAWLALAALWRDEDVPVRPRPTPSGRIRRLPYGFDWDGADRWELPEDELIDCQVALTGGADGTDAETYLLLSVGPELVHDHADAGAIHLLTRGDTTLLGTNGYLQRELLYHNVFYAQPADWDRFPADDHDRIRSGDPDCRGVVEALDLDGDTAHCRVGFEGYHGLPLDVTRTIDIDALGEVTLVDRVVAREDGYRGGPLFHAETVDARPDGSYRLRTDTLRGLGNVESPNPSGELLVDPATPDVETSVVRPSLPPIYTESYREFPTTEYKQVWQRSYTARNCLAFHEPLPPGKETVFETRLHPNS